MDVAQRSAVRPENVRGFRHTLVENVRVAGTTCRAWATSNFGELRRVIMRVRECVCERERMCVCVRESNLPDSGGRHKAEMAALQWI